MALTMDLQTPMEGKEQKINMTGDGEKVGDNMHLKMALQGDVPGLPVQTEGGKPFELEMVMQGGNLYVSFLGSWMKLGTGTSAGGALPVNPSEVTGVTDLKNTTDVTKDGTEDVRGVKTTIYNYKVSQEAFKNLLPQANQGQVQITRNDGKAWVDDQGFLRKSENNLEGKLSDGSPVSMHTIVEFYDINQPLPEITPPPNAVEFNLPTGSPTATQ